jgi:putative ABC transport system permease protein
MPVLRNDVRFAFRVLSRERGFALTAILTLALGIGATTTIFSVVNTVLLEPLKYRESGQLLLVRERIRQVTPEPIAVPVPDVAEFQRETGIFDGAAAWRSDERDLSEEAGHPVRAQVTRVTWNLFPVLGVSPVLGRSFTEVEDRNRQHVAVLSDAVWRTRYASDSRVLGKSILIDRVPHVVVGVMAPSFVFPPQGLRGSQPADVWIPMAYSQQELETWGDNFDNNVVARKRAGVTLEQAKAVLAGVARRIHEHYPAEVRDQFGVEVLALPLREQMVGQVRTLVLLLAGAVSFLLLIACANIANLMLSRAAAREREFAIRAAVGAGRPRIIAQWLTESLVLAACGGVLGAFLAWYGTDALARLTKLNIPRLSEVRLDLRVLGVSVGISILTGLFFGTIPALFSGRTDLTEALKEGSRGSAGRDRHRVRSVLVVSEVALALLLLTGAGLLLRSFFQVRATDPGFRTEHLLSMNLVLPPASYPKPANIAAFLDELDRRLRGIPGVLAAGAGNSIPLHGAGWQRLVTPDDASGVRGKFPPTAFTVSYRDYFQALGIPLRKGRLFNDGDRNREAPVVIVSESMAKTFWPNSDPIGRRLKYGPPAADIPWHTVVGVVADVKESSLERESLLHSYVPAEQVDDATLAGSLRYPKWAVRSSHDPASLIAAVRAAVVALDPQMPVARLETMEQSLDGTLASRRIESLVVLSFAGAALLLAAIGIYGLIAYSVTQRAQEIGIRMALGATAGGVVRLVLREGVFLAGAGVLGGLLLSAGLSRYIASLLFGVKPTDALTYAAVALALLAVTAAASLVPARRAMRVDPMIALRRE